MISRTRPRIGIKVASMQCADFFFVTYFLLPVVELVAEVVSGHNVQEEDVLGLGVQAGHLELHLREHLPENKK
jgi:hypothetical protein